MRARKNAASGPRSVSATDRRATWIRSTVRRTAES